MGIHVCLDLDRAFQTSVLKGRSDNKLAYSGNGLGQHR